MCFQELLIVPYGIETIYFMLFRISEGLLIVPYGIETGATVNPATAMQPFNRTLWN